MKPKPYEIEFLACSLLLERLQFIEEPFPHFIWKKGQEKGKRCGMLTNKGYRRISLGLGSRKYQTKIWEHRLIWFYYHQRLPKGQIDHINGNRSDNRIENLRDVSARENARNAKCHRAGHLWGTVFHSNGWTAALTVNNKRIYIGRYKTQLEAHKAARKKSIELGLDTYL